MSSFKADSRTLLLSASTNSLDEDKQLFRLLLDTKLASGSSQAKRLIADGGVRIDGEQIKDANHLVKVVKSEEEQSFVLQVGRRRFIRIVF